MIPPIANGFVAGETPSAALDHVADLEADGVRGILNLLGEHYHERPPADEDADAYVSLAETIEGRSLDCCVSVKPSQIGLDVGEAVFEENLARIVDASDTFVWIDMEDHETTDVTLDAFERHAIETEGNPALRVQ